MILTPSQAEALRKKIQDGINQVVAEANSAINRLESMTSWIPIVGSWIKSGLEKFRNLVQEFVDKVAYYLTAFEVPVSMGQYSQDWLNIAHQAGGVASDISNMTQQYGSDEWGGIAGGAYKNGVSGQEPAVDAIQSRANSISSACNSLEQVGWAFYIAVAAVLVGLILAAVGWETVVLAVAGVIAALVGLATAAATWIFGVNGCANSFNQLLEPSDSLGVGDSWPVATSS
jgi:hypothetical protein